MINTKQITYKRIIPECYIFNNYSFRSNKISLVSFITRIIYIQNFNRRFTSPTYQKYILQLFYIFIKKT